MKHWLLAVLMLLAAGSARGEEPGSSDFYAGYYLETRGPGPFFRLELPEELYGTVRRPDFSDLRIFNAAGEILPHTLRVPELPEPSKVMRTVPFFPLFHESGDFSGSDLAVEVLRDGAGTIVTVKEQGMESGERPPRGYLFDLGTASREFGSLELQWQVASSSSMYTVRLEQSDDLRGWRPLVHSAALLDLRHLGERVEKREIVLPSRPQRYLRLFWSEKEALPLSHAVFVARQEGERFQRQWTELGSGGVAKTAEGRLDIDYHGDFRAPVSAARMRFPRPNSLARMHLQSRASDKDPWRSRCRQAFYNLTFGATVVESESCGFSPTSDTLWRVTIEEDGAGIASSRMGPNLSLGRTPRELLFIARGNPPFLLAFASERLPKSDGRQDGGLVLAALDSTESRAKISQAVTGRRIELGGEQALRPQPLPPPWKTWVLWGVLLLGVAMLALMARGLLREMGGNKEKTATKEG